MTATFPWYDSLWLSCYVEARDWLRRYRPDRLDAFEALIAPLRTDPGFEVIELDDALDDATFARILAHLDAMGLPDIDPLEINRFGRVVVWDDPLFTALAKELAPRVSALVGEQVVPCYNFLSLYTAMGSCEVHMDAPHAKWTLDICLRQSRPWPISFSQVVPWPIDRDYGDDWETTIRESPELTFTSHVMEPGQALLFAGSSQWHHRSPMPSDRPDDFCDLLFLHFVPAAAERAVDPVNWPDLIGVPQVETIIDPALRTRRQPPP